jgi:hypothetical protein
MTGTAGQSVNSVCWQPRMSYHAGASASGPVLAAALTTGDIHLLRLDGADALPQT